MIGAIQTHGELLHWHVLATCVAFTPEGAFLEVPEFDSDQLLAGVAGSGLGPVSGRGKDRSGSRGEYAQLGAHGFQRGPVGVSAGG
jgi:hypothetical protein